MSKKVSKHKELEQKITELQTDLPANDEPAAVARVRGAYDWAEGNTKVALELLSRVSSIDPLVKLVIGLAIIPAERGQATDATILLKDRLLEVTALRFDSPGDTQRVINLEMTAILKELLPYTANQFKKRSLLKSLIGDKKGVAQEQVQAWIGRVDAVISKEGVAPRELQAIEVPAEVKTPPQVISERSTDFKVPRESIMFGRDKEIEQTHARLIKYNAKYDPFDTSSTAHVALVGPAGVGKTTLATRLAYMSEQADVGPPIFIRCEKLNTLAAFQEELLKLRPNPDLQPWEELEQTAREELEKRRLFLILDNLLDTHAATSDASYLEFIDSITSIETLTLLITSRNKVFIGRHTPRTIHGVELRPLTNDAAEDLFRHEYIRLKMDRDIGIDAMPRINELLRVLGGLPRAIISAAAQAREAASFGDVITLWQSQGSSKGLPFSNTSILDPETITFLRLLAALPRPLLHLRDRCSNAVSGAIDVALDKSVVQLEGPSTMRSIAISYQVRADIKLRQPDLAVDGEIVLALAIDYFTTVANAMKRENESDLDNENLFPMIRLTEGVVGQPLEQARLKALLTCMWGQDEAKVQLQRLLERQELTEVGPPSFLSLSGVCSSPDTAFKVPIQDYIHLINFRLGMVGPSDASGLEDVIAQAEEHKLLFTRAELLGNLADHFHTICDYANADALCEEAIGFFDANKSFKDVATSRERQLKTIWAQVHEA